MDETVNECRLGEGKSLRPDADDTEDDSISAITSRAESAPYQTSDKVFSVDSDEETGNDDSVGTEKSRQQTKKNKSIYILQASDAYAAAHEKKSVLVLALR
jgi:hypothetical protein